MREDKAMGDRRKAYDVRVRGGAEISLIVYADSVAEANRIADEERNGPDVPSLINRPI